MNWKYNLQRYARSVANVGNSEQAGGSKPSAKNTQTDDPKLTSLDSPASEPTEEEIAEALRIMGEDCACPPIMGTALYMGEAKTVDCPIHGERTTHNAGLDLSRWQTPIQPGDVVTIVAEAMAERVDIDIRNATYEGTVSYGKELESTGQEIQEIEVRDASPGPRHIHSSEGDE